MATSTAELTLILKAKNLASAELAKVKDAVSGIATTAETAAGRFSRAFGDTFKNLARDVGPALGRVALAILNGRDIPQAFAVLGIVAAGSLADSVGASLVEKIIASGVFARLAAQVAIAGNVVGNALALAISTGMAAFPFLIAAAAVAALVYLIHHPEVVQKIRDVASGIIRGIVEGLVNLGKTLGGIFASAFGIVIDVVRGAVGTVLGVIGGIIQAVKDALAWIAKLAPSVGGGGYDLNGYWVPNPPGKAEGGWVGLNGPEIITVGERGPEFVRPAGTGAGTGGGGGAVQLVGVNMADIQRAVERGLLFKLQLAGTGQTTG